MPVRELDRMDRRAVRRFVRLERELNASHPLYWAVPDRDLVKRLGGRSPTGEILELQLLVASDGRPRARCAAVVNRRWQQDNADLAGGVGYFAAAENVDAEVAGMLARAEAALVERGCDRAIAPFNGGALQGLGVLTGAYDESPMCPLPWQPPYYVSYLEASGYSPRYPLWVYVIDFSSETYRGAAQRALADPACRVRPIDKRRWKQELGLMGQLVNAGFRDESEFYEYSPQEWAELWGPLKPVFDPRWVLFAERMANRSASAWPSSTGRRWSVEPRAAPARSRRSASSAMPSARPGQACSLSQCCPRGGGRGSARRCWPACTPGSRTSGTTTGSTTTSTKPTPSRVGWQSRLADRDAFSTTTTTRRSPRAFDGVRPRRLEPRAQKLSHRPEAVAAFRLLRTADVAPRSQGTSIRVTLALSRDLSTLTRWRLTAAMDEQ